MIKIETKYDTYLMPTGDNWMVAYDGCHKLYITRDESEAAEAKSYDYELYELRELATLYQDACPLKFISFWDVENLRPLVPQCFDIDIDCYKNDCYIEIHDEDESGLLLDELVDKGVLTHINS